MEALGEKERFTVQPRKMQEGVDEIKAEIAIRLHLKSR